ncbi:MAG TPA: outer membrane lipoprotein carrier protein LolA [Pyrinomonadaceae bacterium]|jgi:outer membrane lipoprotein-sorting protein
MKKLAPLGLIVALLVGTIAVTFPTSVNAQGAGLVSSLLNNMERNRRSLTSLRANLSMEKYNAQIRDTDRYSGKVVYKPAAGRSAYVRVDWQKPLGEILAVADGQYTLYKSRLNTAYVGSARSNRNKMGNALDFLNMSRQQLVARFEPVQDIREETLWGGVRTTHIKLVPKGGASYKYAEVWVDGNGMPIQTKVVEKNDDATTVRLTEVERNAGVSLDEFRLQLGSDVKKIKS